jgi:hypothetical protein
MPNAPVRLRAYNQAAAFDRNGTRLYAIGVERICRPIVRQANAVSLGANKESLSRLRVDIQMRRAQMRRSAATAAPGATIGLIRADARRHDAARCPRWLLGLYRSNHALNSSGVITGPDCFALLIAMTNSGLIASQLMAVTVSGGFKAMVLPYHQR